MPEILHICAYYSCTELVPYPALKCEHHPRRRNKRTPRNGVGETKRHRVFERDDFTCQIGVHEDCPGRMGPRSRYLTVDHIVPKSKGGGNGMDNLQCACYLCNEWKADRIIAS